MCNKSRVNFCIHFCCLPCLPTCLWYPRCHLYTNNILYHFLLHHTVMSTTPPLFDWSKQLEYNWYLFKGIEKLQWLICPSLPYNLDMIQLGCTARIMNGQDVLCVSATGDGKSALMYLASITQKGTITFPHKLSWEWSGMSNWKFLYDLHTSPICWIPGLEPAEQRCSSTSHQCKNTCRG